MFYVVSYDISDDARRDHVRETLLNFGTRVQYSVFECDLAPGQLDELQHRLKPHVLPQEDSVRYYQVCKDCLGRSVVVGSGALNVSPNYWIV
jgi:CRISPR-associated protein Cas2